MSKFGEGTKFHILTPIELNDEERDFATIATKVTNLGFVRFQVGEDVYSVADEPTDINSEVPVYVVIDRLIKKMDDTFHIRLTDSLRIALEK